MESAADLSDGRAELCRDLALHSKDCRTRAQAFGRSRQQERAGKQGRGCGKARGKQARTRQERGPGESDHARHAGEACEGRSQATGKGERARQNEQARSLRRKAATDGTAPPGTHSQRKKPANKKKKICGRNKRD